ncbi:rhomboid family intramembrane serine protease [Sphingosinicella sp. LHD-64]|uniref:rhomboid family intramembrane serine protease n=1 Tax=Sphingosinicella sp. LHD-64 TaxID=3072139 RepID=UPI00280E3BCB|nr:rhomboid family intramembrane serine protease [Sphingosinicella sp. LHD-64]MDQ8757699.1 rhomboid family intramembrane serine protease [Sphingosinicella sp. LHD-64]
MRPPDSWSSARVTLVVTLATAAAWLIVWMLGADGLAAVWGGFIPARIGAVGDEALAPIWLTPLTATLVHANFAHVALNLLILVFCGRPTEGVLGPVNIVILYVLGAYAAAAAQWVVQPDSTVPMIGASGAISAVLGAYSILFGRNKVRVANPTVARWLNALWLMVAWVVLQIVVGITFASAGIGVAIAAHIGGFAIGLLLANPLLLFRYRRA